MQSEHEAQAASAGCITLPHEDRRSDDAPVGHGDARLRDCHGGDPEVSVAAGLAVDSDRLPGARRRRRTRSRASPNCGRSAANPERAYTAVARGIAGVHPVRQPRRPPRRRPDLRAVPRRRGAQRAHEHDDARRDAVGGGALQQRRRAVQERALRRELRARRHAAAPAGRSRRRRRRRRGRRAGCPSSSRCRAGKSRSPATCSACSSAAARKTAEIGNPTEIGGARPARRQAERSRLRHRRCAPIPSSSACRRRACSIRCSRSPAPTTSPATTAPAAAPPATSSTPTIAIAGSLGAVRARSATTAARRPPIRRSIRSASSPAIRSSTPSRARSRPASA